MPDAALSPFGLRTLGPTVDDLPEAGRAFLRQHGVERIWAEGQEVQRFGEVISSGSWLLAGRLQSVVFQPDGSLQAIGWVMPGELFGIGNLLADARSPVTLLVNTDQARVLQFDKPTLVRLCNEVPGAGFGVSVGLSRRLIQLFDALGAGGPRTLRERLRSTLSFWAKHYGIAARDGSMELWIGQNELAAGVGASRQRIHQELQRLRAEGLVNLGYRKVILYPRFFDAPDVVPDVKSPQDGTDA